MQHFVLLGGTGQLGTALAAELGHAGLGVVLPARSRLDLGNVKEAQRFVLETKPAGVLNAAAFTDVAGAERAENRDAVLQLNRDLPSALAEACSVLDVPFVHVSTDYVFDGTSRRPYREDDPTHPLQMYGASKLAGEERVLIAGSRALIVRTSTIFGPARRARPNYVDAILEQARRGGPIEVVELPVSSPTFAPDLARGIVALLEREAVGVVHVTNRGHCSRLELARAVVEEAGLASAVVVRARAAPVADVVRPAYSVLDGTRFAALVGEMLPPWRDALARHVGAST